VNNLLRRLLSWSWSISLVLMVSPTALAEQAVIGVSLADLGNPFFTQLGNSLSREASIQTNGEAIVEIQSSAYDLARQQRQIKKFIQEHVDLIVLSAANSDAIFADIALAQKNGIIVTAVDIDANGADVTVTSDNIQAGEIACQALVDQLNERGKVAIINGAKVSSVADRVAGCRSVLNNYPKIELVGDQYNSGGTFEGGLEAATFLLSRYEDVKGIFAINDPSALGVLKALELQGNTEIKIVSVDGSKAFINTMNEPGSPLIATAAQQPESMARLAIQYSLLKLSNSDAAPVVIRIPTTLVTRSSGHQ
jgi:ribose transport system substrate-binding protein